MADPRDLVNISSLRHDEGREEAGSRRPATTGRPWLGLLFRCSGKYGRAYRNADGTAYLGRCPTCGKSVRFVVGAGGTSERMFRVECG